MIDPHSKVSLSILYGRPSSAPFAWINRIRRLMRDFERYDTAVAAFVRLAVIRLMLKRLTKPSLCS